MGFFTRNYSERADMKMLSFDFIKTRETPFVVTYESPEYIVHMYHRSYNGDKPYQIEMFLKSTINQPPGVSYQMTVSESIEKILKMKAKGLGWNRKPDSNDKKR